MTDPVIRVERLSRWYGEVIGLNDVTVDVEPGITQRFRRFPPGPCLDADSGRSKRHRSFELGAWAARGPHRAASRRNQGAP